MTSSTVRKRFEFPEFHRWIEEQTSALPLVYFRIFFAAIWLVYDLIDVSAGQTAKILWFYRQAGQIHGVFIFQILLIICEGALILGWRPGFFALCAFLARGAIVWVAPLNDFYYFCVIALILSQCQWGKKEVPAWSRDLLVIQTAWIYFATAFFKLNPAFLSGGDLYARGNYEATVLPLPFPAFYKNWISHLNFDLGLSWMAVVLEMSMALTLVFWLLAKKRRPQYRNKIRWIAICLSVAIHGYAAVFLNVFFFGASMITQVALLTWEPI